MHTMTKLLLAGLCCIMAAIGTAQDTSGNKRASTVVLIHLKITRQGNGYNISVKDVKIINDEKKKPARLQNQGTDQTGLVCLLLDKNHAIIDSTIITEPLVTRYEYPGEDGTIGSKEVALDEKDVMIRSVYDPGMQYLRILKVTGKTKRQSLATLKLPTPKM